MAGRTAIEPVVLNRGVGTDTSAMLVAADAVNGMKVKYEEQDQLTIMVENGDDESVDVTFVASESRHAFMRGQGDMVEAVAAGKTKTFAGLEQMRFKNNDGYLYIDFSAGTALKVGAFITL